MKQTHSSYQARLSNMFDTGSTHKAHVIKPALRVHNVCFMSASHRLPRVNDDDGV